MCFKELEESFKDHCGIFGIYCPDGKLDVAKITYFGLYALQHRGQESSGIAVNDSGILSITRIVVLSMKYSMRLYSIISKDILQLVT